MLQLVLDLLPYAIAFMPDPKITTVAMRNIGVEHQRLWAAINEFIRQQGGAVTSVPPRWPLRVEVGQGSSLPAKLADFGYTTYAVGKTTRVTVKGIEQFDVIELGLPRSR